MVKIMHDKQNILIMSRLTTYSSFAENYLPFAYEIFLLSFKYSIMFSL